MFYKVSNGGTAKITKIGTIGSSGQLNVSSYNNYQNLTIDNFLVAIKSGTTYINFTTYGMYGTNTSGGRPIQISYNSSTGILQTSFTNDTAWMVQVSNTNFDVYIIEL